MAGYDGLSMSSQAVVDVMHLPQRVGDNAEGYSQPSEFSGEAMLYVDALIPNTRRLTSMLATT